MLYSKEACSGGMLSVGLIPIVCPRIHYVDIDLHWGWFIVLTITGQLLRSFSLTSLPAFDFTCRRWANRYRPCQVASLPLRNILSRLMAVISTPFLPTFTPASETAASLRVSGK